MASMHLKIIADRPSPILTRLYFSFVTAYQAHVQCERRANEGVIYSI